MYWPPILRGAARQPLTDELVRTAGDAYCRRSGDHAPLRPGAIETLTALRGSLSAPGRHLKHDPAGPSHGRWPGLARSCRYFPVRIYSSAARLA